MATQETLDRVQALYVAYYGRPADQEGQEYWADRIEAEGEGAIINAFGTSEEYTELSEGQGNATLVNNIYLQAFGRNAEPEGLAYYSGVLANGEKSLAEIALTITNAAQGIDQQTFNARVEAAAAYTADFGAAADYDLVAAKDAIESAEPGLFVPNITAAIEELQSAQQAESDYLQNEVAANEAVAANLQTAGITEPTDSQIDVALGAELGLAVDEVVFQGDAINTLDPNQSIAQAQIAAQKEAYAQAIVSAEAAVAETDGLQAAVNSLLTAETRYETALKAEIDTDSDLDGEFAKFTTVNDDGVATTEFVLNDNGTVDYVADTAAGGAEAFIEADSNGNLVLAEGVTASNFDGLDALISTAQAQYNATAAVTKQKSSLDAAITKVVGLDDTTTAITYAPATTEGEVDLTFDSAAGTTSVSGAYINAESQAMAFNEAVADYQELSALNEQYGNLDKAVTDAKAELAELDVNFVEYADAAVATDGADLFIFDAEVNGGDVTLGTADSAAEFGFAGEDLLYIGDSFTRVNVEAGVDLTSTAQGSASAQEVFFQQVGVDTVLSFESEAFQGSATTGFEGAQVTLTGVNVEDLQIENGYVTIA